MQRTVVAGPPRPLRSYGGAAQLWLFKPRAALGAGRLSSPFLPVPVRPRGSLRLPPPQRRPGAAPAAALPPFQARALGLRYGFKPNADGPSSAQAPVPGAASSAAGVGVTTIMMMMIGCTAAAAVSMRRPRPVARCQPVRSAEAGSAPAPAAAAAAPEERPDDLPGSGSGSGSRARGPLGTLDLSDYPFLEDYEIPPEDAPAAPPPPPEGRAASVGGVGFGVSASELARLVSYAFDHDGYPPASVTAAGLAAALRTSVAAGAPGTADDAAARREAYGVNALPPPHEVTFLELVLEALEDFTVQALLASGLLSLALSVFVPEGGGGGGGGGGAAGPLSADWLEGAAILGTVALVVTVSAATGYAKESKFRQLNSLKDDVTVRVIRGGGPPTPLPSRELLVGDLVIVEAGDILQADGLLVAGGEIRLDQSHLTGESDEVVRSPVGLGAPPVVLSGSKVLDGYGKMLVLAIGPYSQQGSINAMMRQASAGAAGGGGAAAAAVAVPTAAAVAAASIASMASADGESTAASAAQRRRRRRQRSLAGLGRGAATAIRASAAVAAAALASVGSVASYDADGGDEADHRKAATAATADGGRGAAAGAAAAAPTGPSPSFGGGGGGGGGGGPEEGAGMRVETFLTQKLQVLAQRIGAFGVAAAGGVFVVNAAAYTAGLLAGAGDGGGGGGMMDVVRVYLDMVITSITILVVAVPEGLPLAVTLALAFSVQRMLADNNLVRQLGACETMGAATTICSDKTGTLTSNDMTVVRLWAAGRHFRVVRTPAEEPTANRTNRNHLNNNNGHDHSSNRNSSSKYDSDGGSYGRAAAVAAAGFNGNSNDNSANGNDNGQYLRGPRHAVLMEPPSTSSSSSSIRGPVARLVPIPAAPEPLAPPPPQNGGMADAAAGGDSAEALTTPTPTPTPTPVPPLLPAAVRSLLIQGLVVNSTSSLRTGGGDDGGGAAAAAPTPAFGSFSSSSSSSLSSSSLSSSSLSSSSSSAAAAAPSRGPFQRSGSPTECALLELPYNLGWGWEWSWGAGWGFRSRGDGGGGGAGSAGSGASSFDGEYVSSAGGDNGADAPAAPLAAPPAPLQMAGGSCQVLQLVPFSSQRKRMTVVVSAPPEAVVAATYGDASAASGAGGELGALSACSTASVDWDMYGSGGQGFSGGGAAAGALGDRSSLTPVRVLTKGAAELVLERCAWQLGGPDGTTLLPLASAHRRRLLSSFSGQGDGSLRLLALAYRDMLVPMKGPATAAEAEAPATAAAAASGSVDCGVVGGAASYCRGSDGAAGGRPPTTTLSLDADALERDMVLVGLLGLEDPLRTEVPAAVAACQRAGITVRMVTGDNVTTAASIAQQAGILPPDLDVRTLVAAGPVAAAAAVATAAGGRPRRGEGDSRGGIAAAAAAASDSAGASSFSVDTTPLGALAPSYDVVRQVDAEQVPYLVLEGSTFRQLVLRGPADGGGGTASAASASSALIDTAAFLALWPRLRVLARCSPGDKFVVISALKQLREEGRLDEVVAVTGDGTNDAPALTAADVGFCMNTGTAIAREAADILLLDSSFRSIVSAVAWGRNVYASVRRFLQFQLTANVVAVAVAAGGAVWLRYSPLSAVQMLWVNLIMDSLASLALATEAPTDAMLDAPPNRPNDPLVTPTVLKHILGQAAFQLAVLYGMLAALEHYGGGASAAATGGGGGLDAAMAALFTSGGGGGGAASTVAAAASSGPHSHVFETTMVFNTFVQMQLFNQLNCRRTRDQPNIFEGITAHPLFLAIVAGEAVLQYLIVQYGGDAFSTTPLTAAQWGLCAGFGATSLLVRAALRGVKVGTESGPGSGASAGAGG